MKWYSTDFSLLADLLIMGDELNPESPMARRALSELTDVAELVHDTYVVLLNTMKINRRMRQMRPYPLIGSRPEAILLDHLVDQLRKEKPRFIEIASQYVKLIGVTRELINSSENTAEDEACFEMILRKVTEFSIGKKNRRKRDISSRRGLI
ncbi:hypothetical protein CPB84DRAFT_1753135 [Gymnopilus junonius]|uniref:Uncharacterized protein n=1 Tax=Gymnopilus junonius TaxID=109634 RepID=A0A9P5N8N0_GYMJU|nr:hypothetical protein CPB84DRAFT_1753135 [Gymnopilus junonius]